jgi:hypothetical protein
MSRESSSPRHGRTWSVPVLLALTTAAGLLCALLGEQSGWKVLAWFALSVPVITAIRFTWFPRS